MGVGALLPMAASMIAAETVGPMIGTAISSMLPAAELGLGAGEALIGSVPSAPSAIPVAGATIPASSVLGLSTNTLGKGIAGLGGAALGGMLGKAVSPLPEAGGPLPTPGAVPMPSHKGIETPQFQFQTVGPNPSAVIGSQGGGDLTELLKRFAR